MTKRRWLKSAIEEAKKSDPHMPWTRPVQNRIESRRHPGLAQAGARRDGLNALASPQMGKRPAGVLLRVCAGSSRFGKQKKAHREHRPIWATICPGLPLLPSSRNN